MKKRQDIYTGIELGSDMIRVVVASFQKENHWEGELIVHGYAEVPSLKILKDEPVVPDIVADQLRQALSTAWEMSGLEGLPGVLALAISGDYIRTQLVSGTIDMEQEVTISEEDCERATRETYQPVYAMQAKEDCQDIFPLPLVGHRFRLADGSSVFSAVGHYSSKLTAESLCFPTDALRYDKINTMIRTVLPGTLLDCVAYAPVAVASAILPPTVADEPQGLVIDLGTGMTSYAIPTKIGMAACGQLAVGLDHLANDLSIAFTLGIDSARQIVNSLTLLNLTIVATKDGNMRLIDINEKGSGAPIRISASAIEEVLEMRMKETLQIIRRRLEEQGVYQWVGNEILLTGVGASLPRITELASSVFGRHVRVALPYQIRERHGFTLGTRHAMVLGLVRAACQERCIKQFQEAQEGGFLGKIKNWFTIASDC